MFFACKTLCQGVKSGNVSVLGVGHSNHQIVLVTSDHRVYTANQSTLTDTLDLSNSKAVPLWKKWPMLNHNLVRSSASFQGFTLIGSKDEYLMLFTLDNSVAGYKLGLSYDMNRHQSHYGLRLESNYQALISCTKELQVYAIRKDVQTGDLQLALIKLDNKSLQGEGDFIGAASFYPLCARYKSQLVMMKQTKDTCEEKQKLDWPSKLSGFVGPDANFHLFSHRYVLTFPEKVYTKPGTPQKIINKTMECFVGCEAGSTCDSDQDGEWLGMQL